MKNIRVFLSENFHFLVVKFSVYFNRHVFEMQAYHGLPYQHRHLFSWCSPHYSDQQLKVKVSFCLVTIILNVLIKNMKKNDNMYDIYNCGQMEFFYIEYLLQTNCTMFWKEENLGMHIPIIAYTLTLFGCVCYFCLLFCFVFLFIVFNRLINR